MHPSGPEAPEVADPDAQQQTRRETRTAAATGARRGRRLALALVPVLLLAGAGGYAAADAADVVPGVLTTDPLPVPDPLPVAPGTTLALPQPQPLAAAGTTAPPVDPTALAAVLGPLLADPALGPSVGASVVDVATGQVLLEQQASVPREPASTAKVLTAAAALHRLGGATTLPTTAVAGGPGEVVLVGGGDVLLGPGAGDPAGARGRAGLGDLAAATAQALRAAGTTSVSVLVDDSLTGGAPGTSPRWAPSDLSAGFVAPLTALAVDAGRLRPERYAPRTPDPALAAASAFADRLREQGITVTAGPVRGAAPAGAVPLAEVRSAPLADVVALMLAESDNTVAEALARLVALDAAGGAGGASGSGAGASGGEPFAGSGAEVLAAVAELGVAVDGAVLVDASGLGDGSLVPAAALAQVLALAGSADGEALRPLLTGLPVAGLTGTLSERFRVAGGAPPPPGARAPAAPGAGVVRAKTGSLLGVTTLAGTVVTADGRPLAFAVVADQVRATDPARRSVDAVAAALAACGCR